MGYAEQITQAVNDLPEDKQAEVLDFVQFLKLQTYRRTVATGQSLNSEQLETFLRSFDVDVRSYQFNRDEANAR